MKKIIILISVAGLFILELTSAQTSTYCNPLNLDYTYMVYNANQGLSYRSGADPAVVEFRDGYFMFVTRSMGYWYSQDLLHWTFIRPEKWYFQGSNAPAAFNYKDSVLYVAGDPSGSMSILYTDDPIKGDWKATPSILNNLQDPALFIEDNGAAYLYWGSSNKFPIRGMELNKELRFRPVGERQELFNLVPEKHGWERFGQNNSDPRPGYIEGAWMTKHDGKYYLQYAAPGTQFNVYGDGAYVSVAPMGPFEYMPNSPFSFKPGGFINGAGHGSTVKALDDSYWHFATMDLGVNIHWERRIGMFPAAFDKVGLLHCNTTFGDYPHYAPTVPDKAGAFTGWMLLSYNKPVKVSSHDSIFVKENLVDENIKTFWLAESNGSEEWVEIDLGEVSTLRAVQINYHDFGSGLYGKLPGLYHRYVMLFSSDGQQWDTLVDKSGNYTDVPNDYVELSSPVAAKYIRFVNVHVPTPHLAISGLRIFGNGHGEVPKEVSGFNVNRHEDRRDVTLTWKPVKDAQGYNVHWGIAPDKMYNTWLVYGENELLMRNLNTEQPYYFSVEAFNENGVSEMSKVKSEK